MKKNKKIAMEVLSSVVVATMPIVAVVSCGDTKTDKDTSSLEKKLKEVETKLNDLNKKAKQVVL